MVRWPRERPSNHEDPGQEDGGSLPIGPSWFEAPLTGCTSP